ncbi:hypothetical protein BKA70DRAFT_774016 [Coprinopsis sp. MPI-PUGE-AT-0042]|nr:hypothetical protein BKA70DRAFT_774016 [Coprinopsis sp. MPI-PUGE-AT-0042]
MPSFLTVVEDTAPFLTYSDGWRPGTSNDDKLLDRYSESSFTVTASQNAAFSFNFFGTSVGIYGAKRGNHGRYQVTIDGTAFPTESAAGPDSVNQTLFSTGLDKGEHTVRLSNLEAKFRDIDYVAWEQSVGKDDEQLIVNTIQDSHPSFIYTPADRWGTSPPFVAAYSGGDGHATNSVGATARLRFRRTCSGDAIALYGPSGSVAAPLYSVRVDNRAAQTFSAAKFDNQAFRAKQLMYFGGNLGSGEHELVVTLGAVSSSQQFLSIDYAEIFTTPSLGGSFASATGGSSSSTAPIGLIVAVAITGALAVICLALLVWIFVLVKKGKLRRPSSEEEKTYPDPSLISSQYHAGGPNTHHTGNSAFTPTPYLVEPLGHHHQTSPSNGTYSSYPSPDRNMRSPAELSQGYGAPISDTATFTSGSSGPVGVSFHLPSVYSVGSDSFRLNYNLPAQQGRPETRFGSRNPQQFPHLCIHHEQEDRTSGRSTVTAFLHFVVLHTAGDTVDLMYSLPQRSTS